MEVTVYRDEGIATAPPEPLQTLLERDAQAIWVDLDRSRPDDLRVLSDVFHFHPLAIEDAQKTEQRPKVESYDEHLFLTIHAPRYERLGRMSLSEVDIFFTRQGVVTVREAGLPALDEARMRLSRAPLELRRSPDYVLYTILDAVVDTYFPVLDVIDNQIDEIEETLFRRTRPRTLGGLFRIKHALLLARRHVVPLRDTVNVFMRQETPLVSRSTILYFRDIYDHLLRITDQIDTHRDLLTGAVEVYLSLVSNRLNEVMKVLAVITSVFAVWTVIAGVYGMNFTRPWPRFDAPYGFGFAIGLMLLLTAGIVVLFRRLRYL